MTGPEHYKESERLLAAAVGYMERSTPKIETDAVLRAYQHGADHLMARAQVHATLALAAAAAYPAVKDYLGDEAGDPRTWTQVLS